MRTYQVSERIDADGERAIVASIRNHVDDKTAVSIESGSGEVNVEDSADPQIVLFAIEGAGYTVDRVTEPQPKDHGSAHFRDGDELARPPGRDVKGKVDAGEFDPDEPIDSAVTTEDEPPALVETIDPAPVTPPDKSDGRQ
jgi:copper chaperone